MTRGDTGLIIFYVLYSLFISCYSIYSGYFILYYFLEKMSIYLSHSFILLLGVHPVPWFSQDHPSPTTVQFQRRLSPTATAT